MVLQLPKLLDDGCVLQAGATIHIWGAGDPGRGVLVRLDGKDRTTRVGDDGSWSVPYGPIKAGGPYDLTVRYEDGTECISRQCYAGEVFLCSGQSNMELPMAWVRADYPLEWDREPDPLLRQYKAIPDCDFNGPRNDHDHAFWQGCDAETLGDFSALAYFFGHRIRQWLNVPVGLLNVSLGGSPIESWMDADALRAFPEALADLEPYLGDGVASKLTAIAHSRISSDGSRPACTMPCSPRVFHMRCGPCCGIRANRIPAIAPCNMVTSGRP